jgi:ABC-2 type transport system permease protein
MNVVAFRHALFRSLRTALILAGATGLFYWVILLSSSSFFGVAQELPPFFREPPRIMQAFLGGSADFISPVGWLSTGTIHPVILSLTTIGGFMAVARSGATELEHGTLDLVLTRPVGRVPYLVARAAAALVLLTTVELGGLAGTMIARASVKGVDRIPARDIAMTFAGHWLLFAAFTMIALLIFARGSLRSRALGLSIGIVVGMFFLNFLSLLFDATTWMGYLSPFHYYNAAKILSGEGFLMDWLVLAGIAVAAGTAAVRLFARRDLTR